MKTLRIIITDADMARLKRLAELNDCTLSAYARNKLHLDQMTHGIKYVELPVKARKA